MSKFTALQRLYEPWLVYPSIFEAYKDTLLSMNDEVYGQEIELNEENPEKGYITSGPYALVSLKGTMIKNPTAVERVFMGATCTSAFTDQVNELAENPNIMGVLLDMDSGGGSVQGVIEASQAVARLAENKAVVAYTDGMMASACYWVGSQSGDIIGSPSSRVGSIGVYVPVADYSEQYAKEGVKVEVISNKEGVHKGAGIEGTSLTDTQRSQIQAEVEEIFEAFKGAVEGKRSVDKEAMQGQAFMANSAQRTGLIDAVGDFEDAIKILERKIKNQAVR